MQIILQIFYICCAIAAITAQVIYNEPCPTHVATSNFNLSAYLGRWYELQRYESDPNKKGDCVTLDLKEAADNNNTIEVREEIRFLPAATMTMTMNGTLQLNQSENSPPVGHLYGRFGDKDSDYLVLSTDYQNYALVWSCEDLAENKSQRKC